MQIKIYILIFFFFLSYDVSFPQSEVNEKWVKHYPDDRPPFATANKFILDKVGNIYITGTVLLKYDSLGNREWVKPFGGKDIKVDKIGNIYIAGTGYADDYLYPGIFLIKYAQTYSSVVEYQNIYKSRDYSLSQNYPNPFNPLTTIYFSIPKINNIKLKIYDILGREIETILDKQMKSGEYHIRWEPQNLASGIYFYQLQAEKFIETKKLILQKRKINPLSC